MKTISEAEFSYLCDEVCADRKSTWRTYVALGKEDLLWWAIFRGVCHYFGEQPVLFGDTGDKSYSDMCRYNILRVVVHRQDRHFNAVQIAYNHVRVALRDHQGTLRRTG
jgi:hypothetical protein